MCGIAGFLAHAKFGEDSIKIFGANFAPLRGWDLAQI